MLKNSIIIFICLLVFIPVNSEACRYQMLEQDGQYLLIKKSMGDLPDASKDLVKTKIKRRGLVDIEIEDSTSQEKRKTRIDIVYESKNKEDIEKMYKFRCSKL